MQKSLDKDSCFKYIAQNSVIICLHGMTYGEKCFKIELFSQISFLAKKEHLYLKLFHINEQRVQQEENGRSHLS